MCFQSGTEWKLLSNFAAKIKTHVYNIKCRAVAMLMHHVMKSGTRITTQQRELKIIYSITKIENNFSNRFSIDYKVDVANTGDQQPRGRSVVSVWNDKGQQPNYN